VNLPLLNRRQFLIAGAAIALTACSSKDQADSSPSTPSTASHDTSTPSNGGNLWIPPILEGTTFNLVANIKTKQFHDGAVTPTYAYNDTDFWGPTLIMKKGDIVSLNVTNNLDEETTTHWHGFHIPPEMDGGPHQVIGVGKTWSPSFEVKNNAATYWYHPHMHESTWDQMNHGLGGFIIVQDDEESALALPRTYGVDDIPLMLTSRTFSDTNEFVKTEVTPYGDEMLTNGTLNANVELPAQLVRFRILNGEIERGYNLGLNDGRSFYVIGTDGGLLGTPVQVEKLIVYPGERYEIILDLSKDEVGSTLILQAFNGGLPFGFAGAEPAGSGDTFGSTLNNTTFDVLAINVIEATSDAITDIPSSLSNLTLWTANDATSSRTINITDEGPGTPFTFDNSAYNMDTINQTVKLNTIEKWAIQNGRTFSHSFHIHDVQFALVSRSTGEVPEHEKGWKDTFYFMPNEKVEFVAKFDDFASSEHPFMYHCHMANHEDGGLMGQFLVVE